jgi:hypothetical protein
MASNWIWAAIIGIVAGWLAGPNLARPRFWHLGGPYRRNCRCVILLWVIRLFKPAHVRGKVNKL